MKALVNWVAGFPPNEQTLLFCFITTIAFTLMMVILGLCFGQGALNTSLLGVLLVVVMLGYNSFWTLWELEVHPHDYSLEVAMSGVLGLLTAFPILFLLGVFKKERPLS